MDEGIGALLRALRVAAGLSQDRLAERAGLSTRAVSELERGRVRRPRMVSVRLLADALGLTGADREQFERAGYALHERLPDAAPVPAPPRPAHLPADTPAFTGRETELAGLDQLSVDPSRRPATAVVSGPPGVGKTTLTVHWAHRARMRFPDGQLYVDLRGYHPDGRCEPAIDVVRHFLTALGVESHAMPAAMDPLVGLYRSVLADLRVLIVLDNARDADQVRPLLPGAAHCMVLVTSRDEMSGLISVGGAQAVTLDLFPAEQAREFLAERLGRDRVGTEPQAVEDIIDGCGRLPLALAIVAGRAVTRPRFRLATIAAHIRLDALSADDDPYSDLRSVFSWSTRLLSASAARLFRLLAVHPGPDISVPAAASLAGMSPAQVRPILTQLTRAHLAVEHVPQRYQLHDLLRAYAAEEVQVHEPEAARREALRRVLDHYLHSALAARLQIAPQRALPVAESEPPSGVTPERPADLPAAVTWCQTEHPVVVALIAQGAEWRFDTHAIHLAAALFTFQRRRGHWHDGIATQRIALAAAGRLGDETARAYAYHRLALFEAQAGNHHEAHGYQREALAAFTDLDDPVGLAEARLAFEITIGDGDPAVTLRLARRTLQLYRASGDEVRQADALTTIGHCQIRLGEHRAALVTGRTALTLHQRRDDLFGQAADWTVLGHAHRLMREHDLAAGSFNHAAHLYRTLGVRYDEAAILTDLGTAYQEGGDHTAARAAWRRALTILEAMNHPTAGTLHTRLATMDG